MKSKNNFTIMLSSVLCILPLILSFILYKDLPDQIAVHWDSMGSPDNFLPKPIAAFGLPFLFLALNIFSKIRLYSDPKRANASKAMQRIIEWLIPLLSLFAVPVTLYIALGVNIPLNIIVPVLTGIILILIGNYLPKNKQNYIIGIRLPWTLHNSDNWNKTHRFAGYVYIVGGISLIILTFILSKSALFLSMAFPIVILLVFLPFIYSYALYNKNANNSHETENYIDGD